MEKNGVKMIDLTQFMLMESSGDSEAKSDLDKCSFSRCHQGFFAEFDDDDDDNNGDNDDDGDAESCSYGSSRSGYADGICHGYRDKKNVYRDHDHDGGMSYHDHDHDDDDDDEDEDEDDDDAIDSKMVEVSKKFGACRQDKRSDCSKNTKNTRFFNEKENDKNFWETCLAS